MRLTQWVGVVLYFSLFSTGSNAAELGALATRTDTYLISEMNSGLVPSVDVDLVLVVDNSGSMWQHHANLMQMIPTFIARLRVLGVNAKIGITSADENQPFAIGMAPGSGIYSRDANAELKVNQAIQHLGDTGSGTEKPFSASLKALELNPGFKRPNTATWTVFYTDAPEQSAITAQDYWARASAFTGSAPHYVSAILGATDFGCEATNDPLIYQGSVYEQVIQLSTGGRWAPLCAASSSLESSLLEVADLFPRGSVPEFSVLLNRAVASSVQVFYRGFALKSGTEGYWTYDASQSKVVFKDLSFATDPVRDQISITYEIQ